ALASAQASRRFDLVGLHWQGPGSVAFRVRSVAGRWSPWHAAAPESDDRPDAGSAEARRVRSWRLGSPWWVGPSTRIEYRLTGNVRRLRAFLVRSPVEPVVRVPASAATPAIVTRAEWNADESIRQSPPQYADDMRFAVVHHPAGTHVVLRAVSGHSDTGLTACPGTALYAKLGAIASKAQAIGLPKIYAPLVTGQPGGAVRFQATLSSAKPWTVNVTDATGATVASGSGIGPVVDWAWDATGVAPGGYDWQIAVAGATPASGTLGSAAPTTPTPTLDLGDVSADP